VSVTSVIEPHSAVAMSLCTIVGAGLGLGASLMRRFAHEDYRVAILGRRPEMLEAVLDTEPTRRANCRSFLSDAARPKSIVDAFRAVTDWAGETDVLIYNAAVLKGRLASKLTAGHMAADMAVNVGGALSAIGQVLPAMRRRGQGTILLTGGSLAFDPIPAWAGLGASKAALRNFSLALEQEVRADGVRVAMIQICGRIEPGGFFDPDRIAETYWSLHNGKPQAFQAEIIYKPPAEPPP
jgi:NADP-dependent 3-hydroxy acid dehydrogenase YdfG